ncbi:MAG: hypothetical protein U5S82_08170 [Gammaproteobacteria bacterium]|nr:hypothetical protein [Gammaproteobacteria bacterium]
MAADYHALRRLAPFRGTLQVVQMEEGRAYSADGVNWKLELLSRRPVRLSGPWGELGPAAAERRYFAYGMWSRRDGLERAPLNAILGDQSDHPALTPLLEALAGAPALPFKLADNLELWLLDAADALPLALLRSQTGDDAPPPVPRTQLIWRALGHAAGGGLAAAPTGYPGEDDAPGLEEQVMARAGGMARRAQWFWRSADGGEGLGVLGESGGLEARHLPAAAFPPLLVRESWPQETQQRRMDAYIRRLAPALLTLPLAMDLRRHLEGLAARHPRRLHGYHRLLPTVVDRERINAALVAARLEQSAGGD